VSYVFFPDPSFEFENKTWTSTWFRPQPIRSLLLTSSRYYTQSRRMSLSKQAIVDIESIHLQACADCKETYVDPATGYSVFTAYSHTKRGKCCGSGCRHCPFDYVKVLDAKKRDELRNRKAESVKDTDSVMTESSQSVAWTTTSTSSSSSSSFTSTLTSAAVASDRKRDTDGGMK